MDSTDGVSNSNGLSEPYHVRITSNGKIRAWVEFALDFFQKNKDRPLVLHTLPAPLQTTKESSEAPTAPDSASSRRESRLPSSTTNVPRLISVAEIIKREYLKALAASHSTQLSGLHQYNEIGFLEDLGLTQITSIPEDRATAVALALDGRNHVKEKQTPFMRITLSANDLPEMVRKGATYQLPSMCRLSRSAKARARKRQKARETDIV